LLVTFDYNLLIIHYGIRKLNNSRAVNKHAGDELLNRDIP